MTLLFEYQTPILSGLDESGFQLVTVILIFFTFQYHIGQLFMIAKHSAEQSHGGEGVEVVENCPHEDPVHGKGQYTEKRIHLSR